ncbi:unnamed protein product [Strongylus vulgaris]|uniref:Uncharacterized protein n=1 Tax=Strongylus vulgaris TaxID=40348 RepID=A0A3P7JRM8_STRVU|nr:unnamed protein product [Strongylus vulgaris]
MYTINENPVDPVQVTIKETVFSASQHGGVAVPPSRPPVFSASQHGGVAVPPSRPPVNYFILPTFILHVVGLACLWALWYYLRLCSFVMYTQQLRVDAVFRKIPVLLA